jgi:hypothetical protein
VSYQYPLSSQITLEASSAPGCVFRSWLGDAESSDNTLTVTLDSDRNFTALFEALPSRFSAVRVQDERIFMEWSSPALLQHSDSVNGPWLDIPQAGSAWSYPANAPSQYFRLMSGFGY